MHKIINMGVFCLDVCCAVGETAGDASVVIKNTFCSEFVVLVSAISVTTFWTDLEQWWIYVRMAWAEMLSR